MPTVHAEDPDTPDARRLLAALSQTLADITGSDGQASFDVDDVRGPRARFAVARDARGQAVGCGAFRPVPDRPPGLDVAELKRMFALPGTRGVGAALLAYLEAEARRLGYQALWLETRAVNTRAVRFYLASGYVRRPNYGRYLGRDEALCFEKPLA